MLYITLHYITFVPYPVSHPPSRLRDLNDQTYEQNKTGEHRDTPNIPTKILDFRGFDSSTILRCGILRSMGNCPESLSQRILVGRLLVGRLGVSRTRKDNKVLENYERQRTKVGSSQTLAL